MKFTIEVDMKDRWVPHFIAMLMKMEQLGNIGSSRSVCLYVDGDGDFHPKFKFEILPKSEDNESFTYDAG